MQPKRTEYIQQAVTWTFYIDFGIVPADGKITSQTPVCGLQPEQYPTMSDFSELSGQADSGVQAV